VIVATGTTGGSAGADVLVLFLNNVLNLFMVYVDRR
jgi:hypothetical protein